MSIPISDSVHFIGVGGVGMSGIASVAHNQGLNVSGSDLRSSKYTEHLVDEGIRVFIGQDANNIPEGNPTIVVSTAILDNNAELMAAKERGLNIVHRAQMLAHLGRNLETLAVAGTHGKTTTSSMLASVLDAMGESPTFLIGGIVRDYGTNARSGSGRFYVVEADESDKSFNYLSPSAVIVTNVEADHLDHYADMDDIKGEFAKFISSVPDSSPVVVCSEDDDLVDIARRSASNVITYGFSDAADVAIGNYVARGVGSTFDVTLPGNRELHVSIKQNPGSHNALNATAVLALIDAIGLDVDLAAQKISGFSGVRRRFDLVGKSAGVTVVDDYAHHPTEIAATIKAARQLDFNKIHVVFQPHRYSRASLFTEVLHDEFGEAFDEADTLTFMDVFPAGETPVPGISGKTFMQVVEDHPGHPEMEYVPRRFEVAPKLAAKANPGDLIITMGAGDVTEIGNHILDSLDAKQASSAEDAGKKPGSDSASQA